MGKKVGPNIVLKHCGGHQSSGLVLTSYRSKINKREEFVLVHKNPIYKEISKEYWVSQQVL